MSVLSKLSRKLPELPPTVDEHPRFLEHVGDVQRVATAIDVTRRELTAVEATRTQVASDVTEAAVEMELGVADAAARVESGKRRLAELDQQISSHTERLAHQEEAHRRLTARTADVRAAVARGIDTSIRDVHVTLLTQLAQKLEELQPINDRLLALRARHGGSPVLQEAIWFDELSPAVASSGLPNKADLWRRAARNVGVDA